MTEESALIATLEGGALDVRFLSHRAKRNDLKGAVVAVGEGPPLAVPKKTKLYVEFAKRERENVVPLYHAFQQCAHELVEFLTCEQ
jgi:Bardet-Biedl syndrome 1 protein